MNYKSLTLATLAFGTVASATAQTVTYDFNSSGDLAANFVVDSAANPGIRENNGGNGLGGSNSLDTGPDFFGPQSVATTNAGAVSFSTLSDFTVKQSFYFRTQSGGNSGGVGDGLDSLVLGLTEAQNLTANGAYQNIGGGPRFSLSARIADGDNGSGGIGLNALGSNAPGNAFGNFGAFGTLSQANAWYLYETTYAYNSAGNNWLLSWEIFNSDSNGTVGSSVAQFTIVTPQANIFDTTGDTMELYGFLASANGLGGNIAYIDNATLVAVPEPRSYALISGALALGWIMIRRRK